MLIYALQKAAKINIWKTKYIKHVNDFLLAKKHVINRRDLAQRDALKT